MRLTNIRILGAVASVAFLAGFGMTAQAGPLLFDRNITPDIIFGTGNTNGNFTVDRNGGVELGLRAKIPFAGIRHSNGDGTYSYTFADERAAQTAHPALPAPAWNFEWTVNTDWNNTTGKKINAFTYQIKIDYDPSLATNFLKFDPITPTSTVPFFDHSIGTNSTGNGSGTDGTAANYAGLIANNNVLQQSWRQAFFPGPLTYDPLVPGYYDIVLTAFDPNNNGAIVASTNIQAIIGIPEPGTLMLFAFGLIGLAILTRRRRTVTAARA